MNTSRQRRSLLAPVGPAPAVLHLLGRGVDWAVITIGAFLTLAVFINVVMHQFGRDMAWLTELGEMMMVWVTFLGGACAARRGLHMSINEFIDRLEPANRLRADATVAAISGVLMAIVSHYGWHLVQGNWDNTLTVLSWPMAWHYMGMAVGCTLMSTFMLFDAWQAATGVPREQRYPTQHGL